MKPIVDYNKGIILICVLALIQSIFRLAIPLSIISGSGPSLENPVSDELLLTINLLFIVIGLTGLIFTYGLWKRVAWGFYGTLALSVGTIIFDLIAGYYIQASAYMGLILPAIFIIYLFYIKNSYLEDLK